MTSDEIEEAFHDVADAFNETHKTLAMITTNMTEITRIMMEYKQAIESLQERLLLAEKQLAYKHPLAYRKSPWYDN